MIIEAILKINPNAQVVVRGNDINTCEIEWHNGTTPISKADIEAQFPIVEFDMAMKDLRTKRNKLLQDTDHYALSDQTLSDDMRTYRQSLRDITNGLTTVEEVNAVELDNAMADLRTKRNQLLIDTDFHALSDNTMSEDMTTYRQELRDITEGITTVEQANAVVFPTKP